METAEWGGVVSCEVPDSEGEVAELYYRRGEQRLAQIRVGAELCRVEYGSDEDMTDFVPLESSGGARAIQLQSGAKKDYHPSAWMRAYTVEGVMNSRVSCDDCNDVISGACFVQSKLCAVSVVSLLAKVTRQLVTRLVPVIGGACIELSLRCDYRGWFH